MLYYKDSKRCTRTKCIESTGILLILAIGMHTIFAQFMKKIPYTANNYADLQERQGVGTGGREQEGRSQRFRVYPEDNEGLNFLDDRKIPLCSSTFSP